MTTDKILLIAITFILVMLVSGGVERYHTHSSDIGTPKYRIDERNFYQDDIDIEYLHSLGSPINCGDTAFLIKYKTICQDETNISSCFSSYVLKLQNGRILIFSMDNSDYTAEHVKTLTDYVESDMSNTILKYGDSIRTIAWPILNVSSCIIRDEWCKRETILFYPTKELPVQYLGMYKTMCNEDVPGKKCEYEKRCYAILTGEHAKLQIASCYIKNGLKASTVKNMIDSREAEIFESECEKIIEEIR